jgi:hypothetical protein
MQARTHARARAHIKTWAMGAQVTKGADTMHTFHSSTNGYRRSCKTCGTPLFCNDDTKHPEFDDITLASVHDTSKLDRKPTEHWYSTV